LLTTPIPAEQIFETIIKHAAKIGARASPTATIAPNMSKITE
jgi:hypothetical protein